MAWGVHDYPDPPKVVRYTGEGVCPDCGSSYINHGRGAGVLIDGDIVCERCAEKFFRENYTLLDLCEAFGFRYITNPEEWGRE